MKCAGAFAVPFLAYAPDYSWIAVKKVKTVSDKQVDEFVVRETGMPMRVLNLFVSNITGFAPCKNNPEIQKLLTKFCGVSTDKQAVVLHKKLLQKSNWYAKYFHARDDCGLEDFSADNLGMDDHGNLVMIDLDM